MQCNTVRQHQIISTHPPVVLFNAHLFFILHSLLINKYIVCIDLKEEDIPEDAPFQCVDCENGIHRCFACKEFDLEEDLIKCSLRFCGKYYHKRCMSTYKAGETSICPLHSCAESGVVSTIPFSSNESNLWRCFRCPVAYESKRRPKDVHIITHGLFLCIRHVQEEEELPEIRQELFRTLLVRSRMHGEDGDDIDIRAQLEFQRDKMKETASRARLKFTAKDESSKKIAVLKKKRKLKYRGNNSDSDSDSSNNSDKNDDDGDRVSRKKTTSKAMKQSLRRRKKNRENNVTDWHTSHPSHYQYQNTGVAGNNYAHNGQYEYDYYNNQQQQHPNAYVQQPEEEQGAWSEQDQMLMEHHQQRRAAGNGNDNHGYYDNGYYNQQQQQYDYNGYGGEYDYAHTNNGYGYDYEPQQYGSSYEYNYSSGAYGQGQQGGYDAASSGYGNGNGNSFDGYGYPPQASNTDAMAADVNGKMNPMDLLARLKNQGILPN